MQIHTKNTEVKLHADLKRNWAQFPTNRCLHLKCSQVELEREDWFESFIFALKKSFDLSSCQIYLCHDRDIFIIGRHLTSKTTEIVLSSLMPQLTPTPPQELAVLFEIGVDWVKLRTLCEKKIEQIKFLKDQAKQKKKEPLKTATTEETLSMMDESLIETLSQRREERNECEILIVEDDPFSQKLVSGALKKKYDVSVTGDGRGAMLNYLNKAPDVVFLDIGLPDISGHDVLKKIFDLDPDAYVVMFSGNGDRENIMKAVELGAKGFVGKPFTQEKMIQYIEKSPFIHVKRKREQSYEHTA